MHSKKLNQVIRLQLDSASMRGPVNRRDIAEAVYSIVRDSNDFWSLTDKREAFIGRITSGVVDAMDERMSPEYVRSNLPRVPAKYQHLLERLPTFICVNASLGLHVLAIKATQDDWAANAKIKRSVAERITVHADVSNDIRLALAAAGAATLEDLSNAVTAG